MRADVATGLGLRARIALALALGFALSSALLALAVLGLSDRAARLDDRRSAERVAAALAQAERARAGAAGELLSAWRAAGVVAWGRVEVREPAPPPPGSSSGEPPAPRPPQSSVRDTVAVGAPRGSVVGRAEATDASGRAIAVAVALPPAPGAAGRLAPLLLLYVVVTGLGILALTVGALGVVVVRPVEQLTAAAERLAEGKPHQPLPVEGAAELARLAASFNAMAEQLRRDAAQREARVAELERATRELRAAQEAIVRSEKLASVGRLSAGLAHEIGNPLAAVLGLAELLEQGGLSAEEQREFLARITRETRRMHRILRDLLDFARRAPEGASSAAHTADLAAVVDDAVKLVAPQKDLRRVDIEQRLPEGGARVRGAHDELVQVLLNLLLNAADAVAGEGRIVVEVTAAPDADDAAPAGEAAPAAREVVLTVRDTGPGIAPEIAGRLFEPFATTKPVGEGTGLGLAVCATIVERCGGRIAARDAPGGGAEFEVRLPAA
jgi:signal transduction histidine kinase